MVGIVGTTVIGGLTVYGGYKVYKEVTVAKQTHQVKDIHHYAPVLMPVIEDDPSYPRISAEDIPPKEDMN